VGEGLWVGSLWVRVIRVPSAVLWGKIVGVLSIPEEVVGGVAKIVGVLSIPEEVVRDVAKIVGVLSIPEEVVGNVAYDCWVNRRW
jgi:hypothetical protein